MAVRVRFAPSPTGLLHVGALRDALHKFLLSRNTGGTNILRIEDTDRTRYSPDSEQEFITTLKWVGIEFDEGPHIGGPHSPYRQSERKAAGIYAEQIAKLLANGSVYKAFDTSPELEQMREFQQINKTPRIDLRACRTHTAGRRGHAGIAVQTFCEDARQRGFSHTTRPRQQIRMMQSTLGQRVGQGLNHMLLTF